MAKDIVFSDAEWISMRWFLFWCEDTEHPLGQRTEMLRSNKEWFEHEWAKRHVR